MKNLEQYGVTELKESEVKNINAGGFMAGMRAAFRGETPKSNQGFWYNVGYCAQVMAGGFNYGSDLKHGQIG